MVRLQKQDWLPLILGSYLGACAPYKIFDTREKGYKSVCVFEGKGAFLFDPEENSVIAISWPKPIPPSLSLRRERLLDLVPPKTVDIAKIENVSGNLILSGLYELGKAIAEAVFQAPGGVEKLFSVLVFGPPSPESVDYRSVYGPLVHYFFCKRYAGTNEFKQDPVLCLGNQIATSDLGNGNVFGRSEVLNSAEALMRVLLSLKGLYQASSSYI